MSTWSFEFPVKHKCLDPIIWRDIPPFAVLTGRNGAGKTQLLNLIKRGGNQQKGSIAGFQFEANDIVLRDGLALSGKQDLKGNVNSLQKTNSKSWQAFSQFVRNVEQHEKIQPNRRKPSDPRGVPANLPYVKMCESLDLHPREITIEVFSEYVNPLWQRAVNALGLEQLPDMFMHYRVAQLENTDSADEFLQKRGNPPWEEFDKLLSMAGLPFRVVTPSDLSITMPYEFGLKNSDQQHIQMSELSSGEKSLLTLAIILFTSLHAPRSPKLFLLDEPDSHLHPGVVPKMMKILRDYVVQRVGSRVLMSTHSPSTVALAPENSLFDIDQSTPKPTDKSKAIKKLTNGLVVVNTPLSICLVEDMQDARFYKKILTTLISGGFIDSSINITLIPSSNRHIETGNQDSKSGGRKVVEDWVVKLNQEGLSQFCGIVDRDSVHPNLDEKRIYSLSRYSIENYIYDPLAIWISIQTTESPMDELPPVEKGLERMVGQNYVQSQVQAVVDHLSELLFAKIDLNNRRSVLYSNFDFDLSLPLKWFDMKGKDLACLCRERLARYKVRDDRQIDAIERSGIVPREFVDLFSTIDSSGMCS